MGMYEDDSEQAQVEIHAATVKAVLKHIAPGLLPYLVGCVVFAVTWPLAFVGAWHLPSDALRSLAMTALLCMIAHAGWSLLRAAAKSKADKQRPPSEQVAEARQKLRTYQAKSISRRAFSRKMFTQWALITVPKSALVGWALTLWLPDTVAAGLAAAAAGWNILSAYLGARSKRVNSVERMLMAEGEKPTPEI